MKLSIMGFENQIEFDDHSNTVLCIRDYQMFSSTIFKLNDIIYNKNETNEIVLVDENQSNKSFKSTEMIINPYSIDVNSKNILKSLYTKLEHDIVNDEDAHYQFQENIENINKILLDELNLMNIGFTFNPNLTISAFLKAIGLKISKDVSSVYELMYNYFEVISELLPQVTLIVCNCFNYLTDAQIIELCKYKNYKHLTVLFIEQSLRKLHGVKYYVIDDDLLEYILE